MSFGPLQSKQILGPFAGLAVLIVATVLTLPAVCQNSPSTERSFAENLDGSQVDPFLASQHRPVVLIFVRTDCPVSNRYAPFLQKMSEQFRGKAAFWLVYPDLKETPPQIRSHLQGFHYSIPALRDTRHALVKRAHATITPEAAVFDPAGTLLYHGRIDNWYEDFGRSRAAPTTHELEHAIAAALEGKTFSPDHADAVGCYISDLK